MSMGTTFGVGMYRYDIGLNIFADLVDRLRGGFDTDRSEGGSPKVGITVVNIGVCRC